MRLICSEGDMTQTKTVFEILKENDKKIFLLFKTIDGNLQNGQCNLIKISNNKHEHFKQMCI